MLFFHFSIFFSFATPCLPSRYLLCYSPSRSCLPLFTPYYSYLGIVIWRRFSRYLPHRHFLFLSFCHVTSRLASLRFVSSSTAISGSPAFCLFLQQYPILALSCFCPFNSHNPRSRPSTPALPPKNCLPFAPSLPSQKLNCQTSTSIRLLDSLFILPLPCLPCLALVLVRFQQDWS